MAAKTADDDGPGMAGDSSSFGSELLRHGFTATDVGSPAALAAMVVDVLRDAPLAAACPGWGMLDPATQVKVRDVSACGGSKTFKVIATVADAGTPPVAVTPRVLILHSRPDDHDPTAMRLMAAASAAFAAAGLAPRRIVSGSDWWLERFETSAPDGGASEAPTAFDADAKEAKESLEAAAQAAEAIEGGDGRVHLSPADAARRVERACEEMRLLARIHRDVPPGWFEPFRRALVAGTPALAHAPAEAHSWVMIARGRFGCHERATRAAALAEIAAGAGVAASEVPADHPRLPAAPALPWPGATLLHYMNASVVPSWGPLARRVVTLHGDFHGGNTVRNAAGDLVAVDFEFACAGPAVVDVAYNLDEYMRWSSLADRRRIVAAYVAELTGDAALAAATDAALAAHGPVNQLVLDCALASGFGFERGMAGWHLHDPPKPAVPTAEFHRKMDALVAAREEALASPEATAAFLADPRAVWKAADQKPPSSSDDDDGAVAGDGTVVDA